MIRRAPFQPELGIGAIGEDGVRVVNRQVVAAAGLGTLLFDLLTPTEELERANVFDIELLGERLSAVTAWLLDRPEARGHPVGYFGASTGAGAALWAASESGTEVGAVVCRGGRPDLAGSRLGAVRAPTWPGAGSWSSWSGPRPPAVSPGR